MPSPPSTLAPQDRKTLDALVKSSGLELPPGALERMDSFLALLVQWNKGTNLIRFEQFSELVTEHVLDSLVLVPHLKEWAPQRWMDLGSGGGFPAFPAAFAADYQGEVVLVESRQKKAAFLEFTARSLGLSHFRIFSGRAEELPADAQAGLVTARALGDMKTTWKAGAPRVAPGGRLVLLRGNRAKEELGELEKVNREGWMPPEFQEYTLPGLHHVRFLVCFKRREETA